MYMCIYSRIEIKEPGMCVCQKQKHLVALFTPNRQFHMCMRLMAHTHTCVCVYTITTRVETDR